MNTAACLVFGLCSGLFGQASTRPAVVSPTALRPLAALVEVEIRTDRARYPVNAPIPVEFILRNATSDFVQLDVPLGRLEGRIPAGLPLTGMGLPLEHVFSGESFRALSVAIEGDPYLGERITMPPSRTIPPIVLAPLAEIGIKFDVTRYYPMMLREGRYEIRWKPYGMAVMSAPLTIEVKPFKQVVLDTDAGRLTLRLLYDKAPKTVDSFLDLVNQRFFESLTFFRVDPAIAAQTGCPKNNGTGRRPDGKTMPPEFNDTPFDKGTVGMSLSINPSGQTDPNSASCQFFIALTRQSGLDRVYTAFALVEGPDSMETLRKIAETPRNDKGLPIKPIVIRSASAVDAPVPPTTAAR